VTGGIAAAQSGADFAKAEPASGDMLPELAVYTPGGMERHCLNQYQQPG
jgi:hypothetical protein